MQGQIQRMQLAGHTGRMLGAGGGGITGVIACYVDNLLECVKRETLEETGIILSDEDIKFCKLYDDPSIIIAYPDGNVIRSIMALYTTTLKKMPDLKCSEESTELRFFSKEDLKNIKIVETHTPILADYFM